MPSYLEAAIQQCPALCVLVFTVYTFLRHMKEDQQARREAQRARDEAFTAYQRQRDEAFTNVLVELSKDSKETASECHQVQRQSVEVMTKTATLLDRLQLHMDAEAHRIDEP